MRGDMAATVVASLMTLVMVGLAAGQTENRQQTEAIRSYMKENFGYPGMETSWYGHITSLSVQGKTVVINTKMNRKNRLAQEAARDICAAISGYVFSSQNRDLGVEHIQVLGADGGVVVSRRGFGDRC